ncbi:hypothetical protein [Thermus amyloliquefaciens]|uniref:hypothetical protein n=1 Tax=Thermus amyloliquefaciens TaxID=1449080 RepID=UPI000B03F5DA|nr:hypothetical protein [Thermus amyloliquefaciens]
MNPPEAARTDPLTGLDNRRALEEAFPLVLREARSLGKPHPPEGGLRAHVPGQEG